MTIMIIMRQPFPVLSKYLVRLYRLSILTMYSISDRLENYHCDLFLRILLLAK